MYRTQIFLALQYAADLLNAVASGVEQNHVDLTLRTGLRLDIVDELLIVRGVSVDEDDFVAGLLYGGCRLLSGAGLRGKLSAAVHAAVLGRERRRNAERVRVGRV